VNIAERFRSPLRSAVTRHRGIARLVLDTLNLLRALPVRSASGAAAGLEANSAIVIDYENAPGHEARVITTPPAPQTGDPLHYDAFLIRICDRYSQRWA
jgi:hypothetical protein